MESNQKSRKKRFIAGAVCPECKQFDTIIMYPDEQRVECVRCDYEEVMPSEPEPEKVTPVQSDDTAVLKFVDPQSPES